MRHESKPEFKLFAYRILPLLLDASGIEKLVTIDQLFPPELPELPSAIPPFRGLGYDVVERDAARGILGFGCSPLSCNGMAEEISEPGPYVIVEVLATVSRGR